MSGGPKYEYLWQDGQKYKKPVHLPANQVWMSHQWPFYSENLVKRRQNDFYFHFQYISLLMDWIETQINDENIFPVTTDVPFPKTFQVHAFQIQFWSN